MALLATQPIKTIYALGATTFTLALVPFWLLKYLTRYGRQHAQWTFRQAISVRLAWTFIYHSAQVQMKTPLSLTPGKEKERFVVIKKQSATDEERYFRGVLQENADVRPADVGATWYPAPLTSASDLQHVTVVLHIHGGAYVLGDGRTEATGYAASQLLKHTPATHILCHQYRLSTLPASKTSNPFPAALQDTLTAYLYLLHDLGIPAKNIVVSGDSAGANNAIAFLRYLSEHGADARIPEPSAALLWSPWIDPSDKSDWFVHNNANYATDCLSHPFTWWGVTAYLGPKALTSRQRPYVNLKLEAFKTEAPLFVSAGDAEVLLHDDRDWAEKMRKEGNEVVFDVQPNAPHDVLLMGNLLGFGKEATASAKRAGEWLRDVRK